MTSEEKTIFMNSSTEFEVDRIKKTMMDKYFKKIELFGGMCMYKKEFFEKRSTGKIWSKTSGFSERLRELRKIKGYSQEEVSEKLGLAKSTYGTYENGKYSPDAEKIAKMADFYNVSADYLLGMEDINDNSQVERRKSIKKELKTISLEFETIIKETQKKYFKQIEEILKKEMI